MFIEQIDSFWKKLATENLWNDNFDDKRAKVLEFAPITPMLNKLRKLN